MRKVISIILCILILMTSHMGVFASGSFNPGLNQDKILLLETLGILSRGDEFVQKTTGEVTKGEFARLLICLINMRDDAVYAAGNDSLYLDVKSKTAYSSEINLATKLGFFGENVSSYFYPSEKAEREWALSAVTRLLGYSHKLRRNSMVVSTLGLTKNVSSGRYLSRESALNILYNALSVPILTAYGMSEGGILLQKAENETVLTEYFDTITDEGIVYADFYTAIQGERTQNGKIRIEDTTFKTEGVDTKSFVGLNVTYYARENDGEYYVIYIEKEDNVEIALSALNLTYDYKKNCYTVVESKDIKNYDLDVQAHVTYNGTPVFDKEKMQIETGEVILIDNNNDGNYDVCKIREFTNIVVRGYNKTEKIVHDMTDKKRDLNLNDYKEVILYSENGKTAEANVLSEGNVLTVYKSADEKTVEIYIQNVGAPMNVSQINFDDNEVTANGNVYKISADTLFDKDILKVGGDYYFYINYWNEIVYATADWRYITYWLLETHKEERIIDPKVSVKGMEETSTITAYELEDKVFWQHYDLLENKIVREKITKEDAYKKLNSNGGKVNRQLMKIAVSTSGKISEFVEALSVAQRAELLKMESDYPLIKMDYIVNEWPLHATYNEAGIQSTYKGTFQNWLLFSAKAKEFLVVTNNSTEAVSDDDMHVKSVRYKSDDRRNISEFEVYMQSKNGIAAEYVIKDITLAANKNLENEGYFMYPYVVTGITECIDEDTGMLTARIDCVSRSGGATAFYCEDADVVKRANLVAGGAEPAPNKQILQPGDIIATEKNSKDKVSEIKLAYDFANDFDSFPGSGVAGIAAAIKGKVVRVHDNIVEYETIGSGMPEKSIMASNITNFLVEYDAKSKTAKKITAKELYPDDTIVAFYRYSSLYMVVVYRNK